jgi:hypothetical protein
MCEIIMCTKVNDAVLACVASSLGDFLLMKEAGQKSDEDEVSPTFLTVVVPVNLRPLLAVMTGNIPNVNVNVATCNTFLQNHTYIYLIKYAAFFMLHATFCFEYFPHTHYILLLLLLLLLIVGAIVESDQNAAG